MTDVKIYVPAPGTYPEKVILKGSGIVGVPLGGPGILSKGDDIVKIYFEGNIYNSSSLKSFESKVWHAHMRLAKNYPTIAKMVVPQKDLIEVGEIEPGDGGYPPRGTMAIRVTNQEALDKWLA